MRYLCLAYGDEAGWFTLSPAEQREALQHDDVIRQRGALMSAVRPAATTVRNWQGTLEVREEPAASTGLPLAGFSVIEADSVEEVIALVKDTPCARARGLIEIHELWDTRSDATQP